MARGQRRKSGRDVLLKSAELIGWALGGLEREITQTRERLAALQAEAIKLRRRIGKSADAPSVDRGQRRRQLSAEARRRISEGMRKRWAERKKRKA